MVVVPDEVREALVRHAEEEAPNEACGLVLLDGDRVVDYVPGRNAQASKYRFALEIDPVVWADIGDRDVEQGIFHSHLDSEPYPSKTDVENIGLWAGRPYFILSLRTRELAAFTIDDGGISRLELS